MNTQFIRSVSINWDKISPDSYLRSIPALSGVEEIEFDHPVTREHLVFVSEPPHSYPYSLFEGV